MMQRRQEGGEDRDLPSHPDNRRVCPELQIVSTYLDVNEHVRSALAYGGYACRADRHTRDVVTRSHDRESSSQAQGFP